MIEDREIRLPAEEPRAPAVGITSVVLTPPGPFRPGASFTVEVRGTAGGTVDAVLEAAEPIRPER